MNVNKNLLLTGIITGLVGCLITWILTSETSPFHKYFLWHVTLPNFWTTVNIIPSLIALAIGIPGMAYFMIFAQWFLIGIFIHWVVLRK